MAATQVRWALFAVSSLALAAIAILPFARWDAPHFGGFLPFVVWAAVFNQLATAYMLSRQLLSTGIRALAALSSAYVCSALLTLGYMATFPTPTSVLLGVAWHYGFPMLVIVYVIALRRAQSLSRAQAYALGRRVPLAVAASTLAVIAAAVPCVLSRCPWNSMAIIRTSFPADWGRGRRGRRRGGAIAHRQ